MSDIQVRTRTVQTPPVVTVQNKTAEDRLYEFVEEQVSKMRAYTQLGNGQPSFYELNEALSNYGSMSCSLITLDVMAKEEYQKAKDAYDDFMAEKYMIARETLNPISLSAQKWSSSREIEYYIANTWSFEYKSLRDEMNHAEKKVAFCRRMLDLLSDFKFNIATLSKNQQAEVLNLGGNQYIEQ